MAARHLYLMSDDYTRNPLALTKENESMLLQPGQQVFAALDVRVRGFPTYPEPPRFRQSSTRGRPFSDVEAVSEYWLISEKAKSVFAQIDDAAFCFVACDMIAKDGSLLDSRWLCDVMPILDLLVEEDSDARIIHYGERKVYNLMGASRYRFRAPPEGRHVFRMAFAEGCVVCDTAMREACRSSGLRGLRFKRVEIA